MTSEVSPKVKLRWESIQFLCLPLFVPLIRGSLDYARDDGVFSCRHFDQVKRVEKSPKAKQYFVACYHTRRYKSLEWFSIYAKAFDMCCRTRYALKGVNGTLKNELMQGIMNWLCHEFSLRSMNCPKGHCGEKVYIFFVFHCPYHSLGDLSTTLEMTVLGQLYKDGRPSQEINPSQEFLRALNALWMTCFAYALNDRTTVEMTFFEDRHFDQVKRVEKSPKAKQYYVACYHTRRYKSFAGFSIYAKAFDMCCRTRYALKGVVVGKV